MNIKLGKSVRYVLSLALAAALLYFSFRGVKWSDFASGLAGCRWRFLAASMLSGLCAFILRGLRWRLLLRPLTGTADGAEKDSGEYGAGVEGGEVRRSDTCDAVNIGNISNMAFPFLGELVRCAIISRNSRIRYDRVLGTVAWERVWDMLSLALLLMLLLAFRWAEFGAFFTGRIWIPLVSRLNWTAWVLAAALIAAALSGVWAMVHLREKSALAGKVCQGAAGLAQGFCSILHMRGKGIFILNTALIWCMYWLQIVLLAHAMPDGLGGADGLSGFGGAGDLGGLGTAGSLAIDALFIMLAGSVASFVPVPGGFGAYHYIVALCLSSLYGQSWQAGIIFATLSHESQAITMLLSGGFSMLRQTLASRRRARSPQA